MESNVQATKADDKEMEILSSKAGSISAGQSQTLQPPEYVRQMSPEERRKAEDALRKKIDIRLMPMIVIMYIMNYLDRNNIAAARLAGMEEELNLSSTEYLTAVSILFAGYTVMQVPSNIFLNKIGKPALYLPTAMAIWGVISTLTGATQNFAGLLVCRLFLGIVEAAFFPGCIYFLSCWYTRAELGFRTAILYSGALISGAFSGLIAAGIVDGMDGVKGLLAWRWLFILEGAITVVIALCGYFILPNFPRTTKWLSEEEIQLAVWRLEEDVGEDDWIDSKQQSLWHGLALALADVKTYTFVVMLIGITISGGVTLVFPTVVSTLGYSRIPTLLLTVPPYVLCTITSLLNAWHADRSGERYFHVTIPCVFTAIGNIILATTTGLGPRYFAIMVLIPGIYTGYVVILAWISNSIPRPPAKRAAAIAFISGASQTASIWTSYMYPTSAAPKFRVAYAVNTAAAVLVVLAATCLRFILVRLNQKLDRGIHVADAINAHTDTAESGIPAVGAQRGFRFRV